MLSTSFTSGTVTGPGLVMTTWTAIGSPAAAVFGACLRTVSFARSILVSTLWPYSNDTNAWFRTSFTSWPGRRIRSMVLDCPADRVPSFQSSPGLAVAGCCSGAGSAFTTVVRSGSGLRTTTLNAAAADGLVTISLYATSLPGATAGSARTWMRTWGAGGSATPAVGGGSAFTGGWPAPARAGGCGWPTARAAHPSMIQPTNRRRMGRPFLVPGTRADRVTQDGRRGKARVTGWVGLKPPAVWSV